MSSSTWNFSEKNFYLAEFRGRSLAIALPDPALLDLEPLQSVLKDLSANGTRIVLLSQFDDVIAKLATRVVGRDAGSDWVAQLWQEYRGHSIVAVRLEPGVFAGQCREVALRLGVAKLVWLDEQGAVQNAEGSRISMVDLADLEGMISPDAHVVSSADEPRLDLMREIHRMIAGGLPAVNLCTLEGLADELFSYAGSGTFFTRERYAEVRRLALDDFDAAAFMIARGVDEGYLVARGPGEIGRVLCNGFGVFIEGRYLAGVCSLLPHEGSHTAEISSLYTVTRFIGEGVGGQLVRHALEFAAQSSFAYVFACTTSERVEDFFLRHGFRSVAQSEIPEEKWQGYAAARRHEVRCVRIDL